MKVGITGTPGTGKTTAAKHLENNVISLKEFAVERNHGEQKKLFQIDIEKVRENLPSQYWIEGHLAHKLDLDYCVVLRTRPEELEKRLDERGYSDEKIRENVEAEAMDLILSEASKRDFPVYELDTTEKTAKDVADEIGKAVENKKERTGVVDWTEFLGL